MLFLKEGVLRIDTDSKALQYHECANFNHTKSKEIDAPPAVKAEFL